jgi:hypothetical protein
VGSELAPATAKRGDEKNILRAASISASRFWPRVCGIGSFLGVLGVVVMMLGGPRERVMGERTVGCPAGDVIMKASRTYGVFDINSCCCPPPSKRKLTELGFLASGGVVRVTVHPALIPSNTINTYANLLLLATDFLVVEIDGNSFYSRMSFKLVTHSV